MILIYNCNVAICEISVCINGKLKSHDTNGLQVFLDFDAFFEKAAIFSLNFNKIDSILKI